MTRHLLCQALELDLADDLDRPAPAGRHRSYLTLLPPPPADEDQQPSTLSTLSLALLQALDRLEGPSDNDGAEGPELPPELDDTIDDLPESERPTKRYTVPGMPPHMRATRPAIAPAHQD
jgi:hypothetical protein